MQTLTMEYIERGLKAYVIEVVEIEGMKFTHDSERLAFVESLDSKFQNNTISSSIKKA